MISGPRTMTVSETSLVGRLEIAEDALRRAGFRRCDSMACNCNSWHQVGGFRARFDEIKEAVEEAGFETNGKTLLGAVKGIIASALTAEAQRDGAYEECAKIAERVGNFGDYKREELTSDFGQPRFDMMQSIASAIRAARLKPESTQNI